MKNIKVYFTSFLSLLLFGSFNPFLVAMANASSTPLTFAQATALPNPKPQLWGLEFSEVVGQEINSGLYRMDGNLPTALCAGLTDPQCSGSTKLYQVITFDVCDANSKLTCIAGIWAVNSSGVRTEGQLVRSILFDSKQAIVENVSLNLPKSTSKGSIWKIPGVKNSLNSETYFVGSSSGMMKEPLNTKFEYGEISAGIKPVREITGDFSPSSLLPTWGSAGGKTTTASGVTCVAAEIGICQEPAEFPQGYRFGLTLRISDKQKGWFHGRMSLPKIAISDWQNGQEFNIEAEPVTIPNLDFVVPPSTLTEQMQKMLKDCEASGCGGRGSKNDIFQTGGNLSHPTSMELIKVFAPAYGDRATKSQSVWFFKNMFNHAGGLNSGLIDQCTPKTGGLTGLVLTNALSYSSGPPNYDVQTGSLVYKVASPHLEEKGEVAQGTYDLSIKSEVARCLYRFSNAPIKAEISITGDDGNQRVATTIVNEKDGWLYLTARGFTFSSPVIRVKLSQEQAAKVEEVKTEVPTTQTPVTATVKPMTTLKKKLVTITCKKGKLTKKVTSTSPKCPAAFSKR